jgi:hypothetical protein
MHLEAPMKRLTILALTGLLLVGLALPATAAAAKPATAGLLNDIAVTGTDSTGAPFSGTLDITDVTRSGSTLLFDGTLTNSATGAVTTFTDVAGTLSHGGTQAVCDILFLDLGPISLDLLGLTVDLSQIILDINAVPGPGNLLATCCARSPVCSTAGCPSAASSDCWTASSTALATCSDSRRPIKRSRGHAPGFVPFPTRTTRSAS